jgi:hypothetical protein
MLDLITSARPYLEFAYFLAGIALCVGLLIAYGQLKIIKTDIDTKNIRSAKEKALEAVDCYSNKFVPLATTYFDEWMGAGLKMYKGPIGDFSRDSIPRELRESSGARYKLNHWLPALNQLQSLSSYFVTGVADECVGFNLMGRTFCVWVQCNYDVIAISRSATTHPYWSRVVALYRMWGPRLTQAELEEERARLDKKIAAVKDGAAFSADPVS